MKSIIILLLFIVSVSARAQEAGAFGVTAQRWGSMAIGFIYSPVENVALRPYVSAYAEKSENENPHAGLDMSTRTVQEAFGWGAGLKAQYYLISWEGMAGYAGIGGSYHPFKRTVSFEQRSPGDNSTSVSTYRGSRIGAEAFFGVQYNPTRWLALYVDLGMACYISSSKDPGYTVRTSNSREFTTSNSNLGVILYF